MKTKPCHCCSGKGTEIDHRALGAEMKRLRKAKGISFRDMGDKTKVPYTNLFELELGYRKWKPELVARYKEVCK